MAEGLSRRTVLHGLSASAVAAGSLPWMAASASSASATPGQRADPATDWAAYGRAVGSAFDRMQNVGGAVAVVSADQVLHTSTYGVRGLKDRKPVTADTSFRVGSTTKSMTAALVATYVDDGTLGWDQKVVDAWSGFRAPTPELTRSLRVRDLLGMGSGIGEPDRMKPGLHFDVTAAQILESAVNLPVVASRVNQTFSYANTIQTVGGYLPLLATGVAPADLAPAWAAAIRDRVFGPAGMTGARLGSDPRGLVENYATGNGFDLRPKASAMPFAAIGAYAPSGGTLASVSDMAAWVRLQLRRGRSVTGRQVVSAANLAECYLAHVAVPPDQGALPGGASSGYGMGWWHDTFPNGLQVVFHTGAFDGFSTLIAFFPDHDLGLVALNAMNPSADLWTIYSLVLLLSQRFGGNPDLPEQVVAASADRLAHLADLGRQSTAVDLKRLEPYLGYYEGGWSLVREGREIQMRIGPRVIPLQVMPDGSYVMAGGTLVGETVRLAKEADGTAHLELSGIETVRRTTGL
ncbi:MAG: serine hydrolase domain-containing protein [Lapillicoccus sp.]